MVFDTKSDKDYNDEKTNELPIKSIRGFIFHFLYASSNTVQNVRAKNVGWLLVVFGVLLLLKGCLL